MTSNNSGTLDKRGEWQSLQCYPWGVDVIMEHVAGDATAQMSSASWTNDYVDIDNIEPAEIK